MRRGWKILIAAIVVIGVLIGLNDLFTAHQTKPAEVTEPGGRILHLNGGDLQVVERGPAGRSPVVLIHCFTCASNWWDGMMPLLARGHRVVAVDLLGHGGSEKPLSGYEIENQGDLVAQALARLHVRGAEVIGHSLGGAVAVALAERAPRVVDRLVIIDSPSSAGHNSDLGLLAKLAFTPVIGEALWRIKPDFSVRKGLEVAFAPGFDVPDAFVDDVKRMTYTAYDEAAAKDEDYTEEATLASRLARIGKPLLVIMGSEEQIIEDPGAALREYSDAFPAARTVLMSGVGHSPNVEAPARTAALATSFDSQKSPANRPDRRRRMQAPLQNQEGVRPAP